MDDMSQACEAGRQPAITGQPVIDPADWTAAELMGRGDWLLSAEESEISHLVDMARGFAARIGDDPSGLLTTEKADFDLGPFAERLDTLMAEVKDGVGIGIYRGLPMDDLSLMEAAVIYWGIGRYFGEVKSNNPEGDMIGHIKDVGKDYDDPAHRGYQTNAAMDYHCDQTDIVMLLCINTAKSGGQSKIASSIAVYNELLKRDAAAVEILSRPYCWTKHLEKDNGEANYYQSPVFNFLDGVLCTSFGPKHMEKGHALAEAPDMTPEQLKAMRLMEQVAEELHAEMDMERGDILLANNYTVMHTRTGFEDWPEPEKKRVLWRFWLSVPGFRPLTPYSEQWTKKGVNLAETKERITLVYEG